MKKDYRIYYYTNGTLHKHGYSKTGNARLRHFYDDLSEAETQINTLLNVSKIQFIIVEYTGKYNSKIIKII